MAAFTSSESKENVMSSTETPPRAFFKLAPELRNDLYRKLLHVENFREQIINPVFDDKPFYFSPTTNHRPPGSLLGVSIWSVKYNWALGVLGVNKQSYNEASHIPKKENDWVSIIVNVNEFSTQLGEAGFKIVLAGRASEIKEPALTVEASYQDREGSDNFVCSAMDLPEIWRALALTSGYSEAKLKLKLTIGTLSGPELEAREWSLLGPFTSKIAKPRSLEVIGSKTPKIAEWIKNFDGAFRESDETVMKVLSDKLEESDNALGAGKWQVAHDKALVCQGLLDVVFKSGVRNEQYFTLLSYIHLSLIDMAIARLQLGDTDGAFKKSEQIVPELLPADHRSMARMVHARVSAKAKHYQKAVEYFQIAALTSPLDPQLREELELFEQSVVAESPESERVLVSIRNLLSLLR